MRYFLMGPHMTAEPKGVVLIISAFNLPLFLTLSPLVSTSGLTKCPSANGSYR